MALITCPDCSNEVSTKAISCPKCGRSFVKERAIKEVKDIGNKLFKSFNEKDTTFYVIIFILIISMISLISVGLIASYFMGLLLDSR